MIKLQIIGHIGNDATINQVGGKSVINFNVAHSEKWTDAQNVKHEKTTWVSCSYWTDRTGVAQFLRKGTQVYVEGIPEVKTWEDRSRVLQAGLSVRVFSIQLLGGKDRPSGNNGTQQSNYPANAEDITEPIDDLPF